MSSPQQGSIILLQRREGVFSGSFQGSFYVLIAENPCHEEDMLGLCP